MLRAPASVCVGRTNWTRNPNRCPAELTRLCGYPRGVRKVANQPGPPPADWSGDYRPSRTVLVLSRDSSGPPTSILPDATETTQFPPDLQGKHRQPGSGRFADVVTTVKTSPCRRCPPVEYDVIASSTSSSLWRLWRAPVPLRPLGLDVLIYQPGSMPRTAKARAIRWIEPSFAIGKCARTCSRNLVWRSSDSVPK